jgi:hypothetical protein
MLLHPLLGLLDGLLGLLRCLLGIMLGRLLRHLF